MFICSSRETRSTASGLPCDLLPVVGIRATAGSTAASPMTSCDDVIGDYFSAPKITTDRRAVWRGIRLRAVPSWGGPSGLPALLHPRVADEYCPRPRLACVYCVRYRAGVISRRNPPIRPTERMYYYRTEGVV